jgi:SAM-dependent methyltransferase
LSPRDPDDWESAWVDFGESASRNPARDYRHRLILNALAPAGSAPRVLDCGSGQGDLALAIRQALPRAEIAGIELSQSGVELARRKLPDAQFFRGDLLRRSAPDTEPLRGWADVAVCSEVLEHVGHPATVLSNIGDYLRPNGSLIVTVPGGPMSAFDRHIGHRKHYRPTDLRTLVERAGYRIERVAAAGFPFFNIYKLAVIVRGQAVVQDASNNGSRLTKSLMDAAYDVFRALFRFNLTSTRFGWQLLLVARRPSGLPSSTTSSS